MGYTTALGYTPIFRISKGDDDLTPQFKDRVLSIRVNSVQGGGTADSCDIVLDDRGWQLALPNIGEGSATLDISLGYAETQLYPMGSFEIDEVDLSFPPKTMLLHGNSAGMNSNLKSPLITSYANQTLNDIVGKLAFSAGVTPQVDPTIGAIQLEWLHQHSGSGHLLTQLERRFNALAKFSDGMLSFTQRGSGNNVSGLSIGSVTLDAADISDLKMKLTNIGSFGSTKASYWDKDQHKLVWVQAGVAGDPASSVPFTIKRAYNTQAEAQAAADAQQAMLNRKGATGSLTLAKGDPSIRGAQHITITGTRSGIDGEYLVSSATHTLVKDAGLTSAIDFESEDGAGGEDSASE
ncbi:phage late control D family protein [Lichenibacterium dinghuense]|uniref:phage late control D family protein n=1 Tax=Lichenibacterium dinghuense TaxID=2895977 RepID=UPI001F26DDE4|nr:hypothetical protein [Lichenibacterium sp. 6Y81]